MASKMTIKYGLSSRLLIAYAGNEVTLDMVNKKFCIGFFCYVATESYARGGKKLTKFSAYNCCCIFSGCLDVAHRRT